MSYKGNTLTWARGRKLVQYGNNTFAYDASGIRYQKNNITYTLDGSKIVKETDGNRTLIYYYGTDGVVGFRYNGNDYYYRKNLQGDVIEIYRADGVLVAGYEYDAWGKILRVNEYNNTGIGAINPFRYRSYYYDTETGLYYVKSRYYDPEIGRFLNADSELSNVNGDFLGYNLFVYCFNNPVNMDDLTGKWPKWVSGVINVVSGVTQMVAGAALGVFTSWTGVGAVAAGLLIVNGAAQTTQGIGQIVNDATESKIFKEENLVRASVEDVGYAVGGDTGAQIAGGTYDIAVIAANLYAGKVGLQQAGKLPVKVNINSLTPNPTNPMTDAGIDYWTKTLSQNGFKGYNSLPNAYGAVEPICVQKGTMIIANGHHRVAVLAKYGVETIKVYLVP